MALHNPAAFGRLSVCQLCNDTLVRCGSCERRRCPCVAARGAQLPLRLFSLSPARSRGSSLDTLETFSELRATLAELFELTVVTADHIEPGSLHGVDMVILCTTEGEGLSETEQGELHDYVYAGGTAIVSAFANWSAHHHYNVALTSWLGVESTEADFGEQQEYHLEESAPSWLRERNVWGSDQMHFVNTGETQFQLHVGLEAASGGLPLHGSTEMTTLAFFPRRDELDGHRDEDSRNLSTRIGGQSVRDAPGQREVVGPPMRRPRTVTLNVRVPHGFQPGMILPVQAQFGVVNVNVPVGVRAGQVIRIRVPQPAEQGAPAVAAPAGMLRRGQVLVLSNLHCFANRDAWNGGHWVNEPGNRALFLNLASDAIAWRQQDSEGPEPEPER